MGKNIYSFLFVFKNIFTLLNAFWICCAVYAQDTTIYQTTNKKEKGISVSANYIQFRIPYSGFFKHGELFNLQGMGYGISYVQSFKRNKHFYCGVEFDYERYRMIFYDMGYYDYSHYYDELWNRTQYKYGKDLTEYYAYAKKEDIKIAKSFHIDDSLMMFFGGQKNYYFDYLNYKYKIGYQANITNNMSFRLEVKLYGLMALNKWKDYNNYVLHPELQLDIFPLFLPVYPLFTTFMSLAKRWNRYEDNPYYGFVEFGSSVSYKIQKRQWIGVNVFISNLSPYIKDIRSSGDISYYHTPACSSPGCAYQPSSKDYGPLGVWFVAINPTMYLNWRLGITYFFIIDGE
ncbi:MAG: hypothetical protein KatS3mg028_0458 [Bacteroidia bacterium]|nr:MAG: hypothetical protein KatS3mg028_0458 [Bacteroidia bacterium]